jgi:integrase
MTFTRIRAVREICDAESHWRHDRPEGTGSATIEKNFLKWRVRPVAQKLGIPDRLVTFQAMRRTLRTDMQQHGTLKDTHGMLRHASIKTTGDVYVQTIEQSVLAAVNSHTSAVLGESCETPIFFGEVQFCAWVGSLLMENCGVHW